MKKQFKVLTLIASINLFTNLQSNAWNFSYLLGDNKETITNSKCPKTECPTTIQCPSSIKYHVAEITKSLLKKTKEGYSQIAKHTPQIKKYIWDQLSQAYNADLTKWKNFIYIKSIQLRNNSYDHPILYVVVVGGMIVLIYYKKTLCNGAKILIRLPFKPFAYAWNKLRQKDKILNYEKLNNLIINTNSQVNLEATGKSQVTLSNIEKKLDDQNANIQKIVEQFSELKKQKKHVIVSNNLVGKNRKTPQQFKKQLSTLESIGSEVGRRIGSTVDIIFIPRSIKGAVLRTPGALLVGIYPTIKILNYFRN